MRCFLLISLIALTPMPTLAQQTDGLYDFLIDDNVAIYGKMYDSGGRQAAIARMSSAVFNLRRNTCLGEPECVTVLILQENLQLTAFGMPAYTDPILRTDQMIGPFLPKMPFSTLSEFEKFATLEAFQRSCRGNRNIIQQAEDCETHSALVAYLDVNDN